MSSLPTLRLEGRYQLSEQLRAYISDPSQSGSVRLVAIDSAGTCGGEDLQKDLAIIALDPGQPLRIRIRAASSLVHQEIYEDIKVSLRPPALEERSDGLGDELKGLALTAIWPTHISAQELFRVLAPPKQPNLFGVYRGFLSVDLVHQLEAPDFPIALGWVESTIH